MVQRHYTIYKKILRASNEENSRKSYDILIAIEDYWKRQHPGRRVTQLEIIEILLFMYGHITEPSLQGIPMEKRMEMLMDHINGKE